MEQLKFLRGDDRIKRVRDRLGGGAHSANLDLQRIAQGPAGELLELRGERGGEEESLARLRALLHDALHVGQKSHVEHAVDLVEHEDVDVGERAVAALQMIEQAAGGGGEDIHAAAKIVLLFAVADAAVDDRHAEVGELGEFLERFLDLQRELACGLEDEAAQLSVGAEALDDREREGGGLAGAGLRGTNDVAALEHNGDRLRLDGRRRDVAHLLHPEGERVAQAERGEGGVHLRDIHGHLGFDVSGARVVEGLVDHRALALTARATPAGATATGTAAPTGAGVEAASAAAFARALVAARATLVAPLAGLVLAAPLRPIVGASAAAAGSLIAGALVITSAGATCAALGAAAPGSRVAVGLGGRMGSGFGSGRRRLRCTRGRKSVAQLRKDFLQHDDRGRGASANRGYLQSPYPKARARAGGARL